MKDKKKLFRYKTGFFFIIAVVLAVVVFHFGATPPEESVDVPMVQVMQRSFNIIVRSIGRLDAGASHMVASSLKGGQGKLIELIDDGTWVKKGEVLAKLDTAPFEEEIQKFEGEIKGLIAAVEAKKQIFEWEKNQVVKELGAAEFKVKKARLEFSKYKNGEGPLKLIQYREEMEKIRKEKSKYLRYLNDLKRLSQKGYDHPGEISKAKQEIRVLEEKFDASKIKVESYQNHVYPSMIAQFEADVEQAEMELVQIKKGSVHRIAQAKSSLNEIEAVLENHKKGLDGARSKLTQTVIRAPSDGIVILYEAYRNGQKRKPRVGDIILQNQPILYLPDISTMIVKTRVREVDLHKVKVGQECDVKLEAYPDKKIRGRIAFVGALASQGGEGAQGAKYFQMTVALTTPDSDLRPGMTSRVSVLAARIDNAVTLPVHAVFDDSTGSYCFCYQNGGYKRTRIETGRENEDFVEILSGLREGDLVAATRPEFERGR